MTLSVVLRSRVTLSTDTVHTLVRWRQGEPHPTLVTTPVWHSEDALEKLDIQAREELAEQRLSDDELSDTIEAMVHPLTEFFGWFITGGREFSVFAAATSAAMAAGFVAVRDMSAESVTIAPAKPDVLLTEFLSAIPDHPAARGEAVSVPRAEFEAGTPSPELATIRRVLGMPKSGTGTLYSALRTRVGARHRVPHPINYVDTADGRWLSQVTTYGGGGEWLTIVPADRQLLAARLREQHAKL